MPKPKVRFSPHVDGWWRIHIERADGRWVQFLRPTTDECYEAWLERERADPYIFA